MKKWIALLVAVIILLSFGAVLERSPNIIFAWTVREINVMSGPEEMHITDSGEAREVAKVLKTLRGEESEEAARYATTSRIETPVSTFSCKTFFGTKLITVHGGKYIVKDATCLSLTSEERTAFKKVLSDLFPNAN